jgi:carboxypeptidase Q
MKQLFTALVCTVFLLSNSAPRAFGQPANENANAPADSDLSKKLAVIAGEAMTDTQPYNYLEELSDDVGGRVTGSPQASAAIAWGVEKMKAIGLENVHTEKFQVSRGWTRISASAELVEPIHHRVSLDSMGWAGSTPAGGAEGEVIPVNMYQLDQEMENNSGKWAGKILVVIQKGEPPKDRGSMFSKFGPFLKLAYSVHAIAVLGGQGGSKAQGMNLTHTGVLGFDTVYDIPVVSLTAEDQDQIERLLDRGKTVRMKINVQNKFSDGPVESANVIGEIRGTQNPEQIIVVGGHLDSWDLAEGSTDNGMGTTTTLGAAEAIARSGFKPLRTLRFVLFTGEEQGLLGSLAYAKMHKDEMQNHVAAVILDNGQGPVAGFNLGGRDDLIPTFEDFAKELRNFGELKVDDKSIFGTDTGPFTLAGLPGINLDQDSPDYKYTHHSAADTFDKISADILARDTAVMAMTAFWIADRADRLATPWPAERVARKLVDQKQDVMLKAFGIWPFGDLGGEPAKQ